MIADRSKRLIAAVLLLLLLGWSVRRWRGRVRIDAVIFQQADGLDDVPAGTPELPRE